MPRNHKSRQPLPIPLHECPVHISVDKEIHVSALGNTYNLHIVLLIIIPCVRIRLLSEREYLCQLAAAHIILPQITSLYKCKEIIFFVTLVVHIFACHTYIDTL